MTCEAYKTTFKRYTEGILAQQALEDLQQHIRTCSKCRAEQREFSHMREILKDSLNPANTGKEKISQAITNLEIQPQKSVRSRMALAPFLRYGAAAAIFLVIGLFIGSQQSPEPISGQKPLAIAVSQLHGDVLVRHTWENGWKKMTPEESIYEGDAFLSLHQASLVLLLGKNNTVSLNENSSMNLLEYNGQTEFGITYGTVKAKLAGPHEPFFISTPQGRFEALGTEFIVRVR
jgi:ferric-dicitrate binding protein FerR (iron transport regulator)